MNYFSKIILTWLLLLATNSIAADTYNPSNNQLIIPTVVVGKIIYKDVVITIDSILNVGGSNQDSKYISKMSTTYDSYDSLKNQLFIPNVIAYGNIYYDVIVRVGTILAVGSASPVTYSVSTNVNDLKYPSSYTNIKLLPENMLDNPCNLDLKEVNYESEWLGNRELPIIKNAPLKPGIGRGMALRDVALSDNPAFILNKGCNSPLQNEIIKTINKLKSLNVEVMSLTQWTSILNSNGNWSAMKPNDVGASLNDKDLEFYVKTAHNAGIKVFITNQILAVRDSINGIDYEPEYSYDNYVKFYKAFQPYIAERASYYQSIGVDVIEVGCGACFFTGNSNRTTEINKLFEEETHKSLDNIEKVFFGKKFMYQSSAMFMYSRLYHRIDIVGLAGGSGVEKISPQDDANLTVDIYKQLILKSQFYPSIVFWTNYAKEIYMHFGIQSRTDALTTGTWLEETGCTTNLAIIPIVSGPSDICLQKQTKTDFSLQAIAYEAMLEHVNQLPASAKITLIPQGYWQTDVIKPYTAFPNISESIRNKPAESILKAWYAK